MAFLSVFKKGQQINNGLGPCWHRWWRVCDLLTGYIHRAIPQTWVLCQWSIPWAQFHRAAEHTNLLTMKFSSLIKTGLPTKFSRDFKDKQTAAEYK